MTINGLIKRCSTISAMLSTGDIPVTLNGKSFEIKEILLKGEMGAYHVEIKTK